GSGRTRARSCSWATAGYLYNPVNVGNHHVLELSSNECCPAPQPKPEAPFGRASGTEWNWLPSNQCSVRCSLSPLTNASLPSLVSENDWNWYKFSPSSAP